MAHIMLIPQMCNPHVSVSSAFATGTAGFPKGGRDSGQGDAGLQKVRNSRLRR